jgi:Xaa-Pro aminopeptidase
MTEYHDRCNRVRAEMDRQGIDYLFVGPSTDLVYLLGYVARQSERLTLFILPRDGTPRMVMPSFELSRVAKLASLLEPASWTETEDPVELLASLLPDRGRGKKIAIGGQLYAYFLLRVQQAMPDAVYLSGELLMDQARMRKSAFEIEQMRAAGAAADRTFLSLLEMPLLGHSEKEVLAYVQRLLVDKGHDSVAGGIIAFGPNGASPHYNAGHRVLTMGDSVVMDYGGSLNEYKSDCTRTFHLGTPTDEFRRVYDIVNEANQKAFEAVRPGVPTKLIDAAARGHIAAAGYGPNFLHRTGHGIGLDIHEPPYIVSSDETILDVGMTFSIEPGIYLPGKFGVRIEDIVVVTPGGAERFNLSTHDLQVLG